MSTGAIDPLVNNGDKVTLGCMNMHAVRKEREKLMFSDLVMIRENQKKGLHSLAILKLRSR